MQPIYTLPVPVTDKYARQLKRAYAFNSLSTVNNRTPRKGNRQVYSPSIQMQQDQDPFCKQKPFARPLCAEYFFI